MRTILLGYHDFGCAALECLLDSGYEVVRVVTHRDDPSENHWFGSLAGEARQRGIPVVLPDDVNEPEVVASLAALEPEFLFSVYFRKMIRAELLAVPRRGALNLHGSLLPAYRGRCPTNWVLVNGEVETGVTLHYMDEKPDHGDVVGSRPVAIAHEDTALTLHRKLVSAARDLFRETLPALAAGTAPRVRQDHRRSSYFGGRRPEDGRIDWTWPAERVYDLVRALTHPYPGAFTRFRGARLFVWWGTPDETGVTPVEAPGAPERPGCIRPDGIRTGRGLFGAPRVQLEGDEERGWEGFLAAHEVTPGELLGDGPASTPAVRADSPECGEHRRATP